MTDYELLKQLPIKELYEVRCKGYHPEDPWYGNYFSTRVGRDTQSLKNVPNDCVVTGLNIAPKFSDDKKSVRDLGLRKFKDLTELDISLGTGQYDGLSDLKKLERLDLSESHDIDVHDLPNLKTLNISLNNDIKYNIQNLPELTGIYIGGGYDLETFEGFKNLPKLKKIYTGLCYSLGLRSLYSLKNLPNLRKITFSDNDGVGEQLGGFSSDSPWIEGSIYENRWRKIKRNLPNLDIRVIEEDMCSGKEDTLHEGDADKLCDLLDSRDPKEPASVSSKEYDRIREVELSLFREELQNKKNWLDRWSSSSRIGNTKLLDIFKSDVRDMENTLLDLGYSL